MTPVISPWVFYLMPICENLGFLGILFGILFVIGATTLTVILIIDTIDSYPDDDLSKVLKPLRNKLLVFGIVSCLVGLLTPSESTITKMMVAQNVTYERVEQVTDTVETVYNDIMELFEDGE